MQQTGHERFARLAPRAEPRERFGGDRGAEAVAHHGREIEHGALAATLQPAIHAARRRDAAHRVDAEHDERALHRRDVAREAVERGIGDAQHACGEPGLAVDEEPSSLASMRRSHSAASRFEPFAFRNCSMPTVAAVRRISSRLTGSPIFAS